MENKRFYRYTSFHPSRQCRYTRPPYPWYMQDPSPWVWVAVVVVGIVALI
ncbi:MAG: hypothetical protein IT497_00045 [Ottowia sp.]|nr:hypothetical protein [Ottowia sp.]